MSNEASPQTAGATPFAAWRTLIIGPPHRGRR